MIDRKILDQCTKIQLRQIAQRYSWLMVRLACREPSGWPSFRDLIVERIRITYQISALPHIVSSTQNDDRPPL